MTEVKTKKNILSLPRLESPPFAKNLIKSAVCEIRFPILTSIRGNNPPSDFVAVLRKDFPRYEKGLAVTPSQDQAELAHVFRSKDHHWTVSLRPWAISLETDAYRSFEDFQDRMNGVTEKIVPLLDTDFFTRVGLRYINVLPVADQEIGEWLNPALAAMLSSGVLGSMDRAWSEYVGTASRGRYNMRFGYPAGQTKEYILDTDFYAEDVEAAEFRSLLPALHEESYSLFHWCLGREAIASMKGV